MDGWIDRYIYIYIYIYIYPNNKEPETGRFFGYSLALRSVVFRVHRIFSVSTVRVQGFGC